MILRLSVWNRLCSFLKARLLAEGIDHPRTHSVRALLEILSEVVAEDKKAVIRGFRKASDGA